MRTLIPGAARRRGAGGALLPAALGLLSVLVLAAPPTAPAQPPPPEYEVKAAFLYHFAQLVEWPDDPADPARPFVVAVVGRDPFGAVLEQVLGAQLVRGHPVRVLRVRDPGDLKAAPHVMFVGAGRPRDIQRTLSAFPGAPVLSVGESAGFAEQGGIIGFRLTPEGRVGFDINVREAERAHLRMSSQLLKLARIVDPAP